MLRRFLENHVLANVTFAVVLLMGVLSYVLLPKAKDPEINFNWININTSFPGASAEDVEKLITNPLEEGIAQVDDINFVSSNSRTGASNILVRFDDLTEREYDKRLNDLRREIQNKANQELPEEVDDPILLEITSSNNFPIATMVLRSEADDERLRATAARIREDLERLDGIDDVNTSGLHDPELVVDFFPEQLRAYGITPGQLADTVAAHFKDTAAGDAGVGNQHWLVRVIGTDADPGWIGSFPLSSAQGQVPVDSVAEVSRAREKATSLVRHGGKPAVMMSVMKKARANTLDLVDTLRDYIDSQTATLAGQGMELILIDDRTKPTRDAIDVMETNALIGLVLVVAVTWMFLGAHIALFIGIGIPFTLAGTFWLLASVDQTMNQSVLLGVVIALGMLVDDAVVVVESIYYRMQRGMEALTAAVQSLAEVFKPVTASVLTTIAAFLPLMLLPGILGDFMFIIPFVVTVALAISLFEAYWMLPVHVAAARVRFDRPSRIHSLRVKYTHLLRVKYSRALIWVLRRPRQSLLGVVFLGFLAIGMLGAGLVRMDFFAFDPVRLFYVNVEMPPGSRLDQTMDRLQEAEKRMRSHFQPGELREMVSYSGQMFTETAPFFGDHYGQVFVSLKPKVNGGREVTEIVDAMRADVEGIGGTLKTYFFIVKDGPPTSKPISVKVRGDDYARIRTAADEIKAMLARVEAVSDITDDDSPGKPELKLRLDMDAVKQAGLNAAEVARTIRLLFDGEVVAFMQHQGDKVEVRVRAKPRDVADFDAILGHPLALAGGGYIALGQLVEAETGRSKSNIRHFDYRRTITVEAELDTAVMDTVAGNQLIKDFWVENRQRFPGLDLDFTGQLDEIQDSIDSMSKLFLFGLFLIYLILGTQFRSYWQPFLILVTVPMAFTGVVYGLAVTANPLSLYTLYGVVALAGIAVNSAIVMIDAANNRLAQGMSVLHATLYAARRRVVPIIITSLTTIAGLFSLATGLGGKSLIWGPVASAIVWGLAFSTVLTLFVVPLLYRMFMTRSRQIRTA